MRDCGLKGRSDLQVWEYARLNALTIVSKDSDFYHRSIVAGPPPKLIWLRIGNCTRQDVIRLLTDHLPDIKAFEQDAIASVLVLS